MATHTLTAVSGENSVTVALPRQNPLNVRVTTAVRHDCKVVIRRANDREEGGIELPELELLRAKIGEDGIARFKHVPTGLLTISVLYLNSERQWEKASMDIRIPSVSNVTLAPEQQR